MKALEQDNHNLRFVGGRSSKTTSLSEIQETAASAIATNATKEMMEEMRRERKETVPQMKHLTDMLVAATTNKSPKTPFSATTPPKTDGVFYNPSATRRVRHPPPKMCKHQASSAVNLSAPVPPAPRIGSHTRTASVMIWRPTRLNGGQGG